VCACVCVCVSVCACVQMPVMNGLDATRNIRLFDSSTPIVAVTASVDDADRGSCLSIGMADVIHKPVNAPKLLATIREHASAEDE
jgi:CheY-like chemotaxis protein